MTMMADGRDDSLGLVSYEYSYAGSSCERRGLLSSPLEGVICFEPSRVIVDEVLQQ